jgi:hypothetical protein
MCYSIVSHYIFFLGKIVQLISITCGIKINSELCSWLNLQIVSYSQILLGATLNQWVWPLATPEVARADAWPTLTPFGGGAWLPPKRCLPN